jgi:CHAD domain-containing protein
MRVAARRLRAQLKLLEAALKPKPAGELRAELRWLGGALGPVRDLDTVEPLLVLEPLDESTRRASRALGEHLGLERRRARRVLGRALDSARYERLLVTLAHDVAEPPTRKLAKVPARGIIVPALRSLTDELLHAVEAEEAQPGEDTRHAIRIAAKRLRYGAELAASFEGATARGVSEKLVAVQDKLGDARDLQRAMQIVDDVDASLAGDLGTEGARSALDQLRLRLEAELRRRQSGWEPALAEALVLVRDAGWELST